MTGEIVRALPLKCPYPWFGGKSRVAAEVWSRLGDADNYIEPFAGSAAVLLARPNPRPVETLNDADHFVANFWRATQRDSEAVAAYADGPVSEVDLHARHRWLMLSDHAAAFRLAMSNDPDHFDAKVAGWWCWGLCCWIGGGWCTSHGATVNGDRKETMPQLNPDGLGVTAKGQTVAASAGNGVPAGRPQLADAYDVGRGVNSHGDLGTCAARRRWLLDWFGRLRDRLRLVRTCCGDWLRVCGSESVTTRLGTTAIFFDPPYALDVKRMHAWVRHLDGDGPAPGPRRKSTNRDQNLYATDAADVDRMVAEVHRYCRDRGANPHYRIALCGYAGEHDALDELGWEAWHWKAHGGYGNRSEVGKANAAKERIWFSPFCVRQRPSLFG